MTIPEIIRDLIESRRAPTDAEADLIVRDGTPTEVAVAMVQGSCLNEKLKRRYHALRRASERPKCEAFR